MMHRIQGNTVILEYRDTTELIEQQVEGKAGEGWDAYKKRSSNVTNRQYEPFKWFGFSSMDALKKVLLSGWSEGVQRIKGFKVEGFPVVKGIKRRKKRSDFGDELDIQSVYSGDLDTAWMTFERVEAENTGTNNVTIAVTMSTSSTVDARNAFWKGATAAILADQLALMGKAVEVIAIEHVSGFTSGDKEGVPHYALATIPVKEFNYPMDKEHLHAVLSPGFHRAYMLKATAKAAEVCDRPVSSGFGKPSTPPKEKLEQAFPRRKVLAVPMTIQSSEQCKEFITKTIHELTGDNNNG